MLRPLMALPGLLLLGVGLALGPERERVHRALRDRPEALTGAALLAAEGTRWVTITDGRWGLDRRYPASNGFDVPIHDPTGRVVALGFVREGDEDALDEVPWGVAEPLAEGPYLERLAEDGLDLRSVPGVKQLVARRDPSHYRVEAWCSAAIAVLGVIALALGLVPGAWLEALEERLPTLGPVATARCAGAVFLALGLAMFALLCVGEGPTGMQRWLGPGIVVIASAAGVVLLVAPRAVTPPSGP
jgi:hypothetical protein